MKAVTYILYFEQVEDTQLDYMKRYPKPSIYVVSVRDFCDEKGNVHSIIERAAWS